MNYWRSIVTIFGRHKARGYAAHVRLTHAYRAVFTGSPTPEDQQIVLTDLHSKSGFSRVSSPHTSADALRQQEGMRELYSHIFSQISLSPADVSSLENAARYESAADNS
jgi:hypothetical protein